MTPADPNTSIEKLRACFKDLESHEDKISQQARRAIVLYAQVHPEIGNGDLKTAIVKLSDSKEEIIRNSFFCQAHDLQKPLYKDMVQALMRGDLMHWKKSTRMAWLILQKPMASTCGKGRQSHL